VGVITGLQGPTGVAVDANGKIWVAEYSGSRASRIDPNAGPIGAGGYRLGAVDLTVSLGSGAYPYNYSDMTGSTLQGAPNMGTWSVVYDSQIPDAKWGTIDWNSVIAGNGEINVAVASSNDGATFSSVSNVTNGGIVNVTTGQYLQVTVNFKRASSGESPILTDIKVGTENVNTPPDISNANGNVSTLWPPNHKFVDVNILGVTDADNDLVTIEIVKITSDEATTAISSGGQTHAPDASGIGTATASVRAERAGNGNGRIYEITFIATDGNGGESQGSVKVSVPESVKSIAIDDGQVYDATQIN
jgi:hypothetical protein